MRSRPRLFISIAIGIICAAVLPGEWRLATRLLIGWDTAVAIFLALVYYLIAISDTGYIQQRSRIEDEGRVTILVLTACAAAASFAAIIAELGAAHGAARAPLQLALATITIVLSWAFTHTIFALHYAHEYYDEDESKGRAQFSRQRRAGLLGLRLFLVRDRHDVAGVRRRGRIEADPPHRERARRRLVLLQCRAAGADREHRGQRDLNNAAG